MKKGFQELKINIESCEDSEAVLSESLNAIVKIILNNFEINARDMITAIMNLAVNCVAVSLHSLKDGEEKEFASQIAKKFEESVSCRIEKLNSLEKAEYGDWFKSSN